MPTIAEIATGNPDFSILVSALTYIDSELPGSDLVNTLNNPEASLTVFAPTNAAFGQLAADLGFEGDVTDTEAVTGFLVGALPVETLNTVVLYHVAAGELSAAAITASPEVTTLQGGTFTLDAPTLVDNEPDLIDPTLTATDVAADNGIVHVIDRVLLPVDLEGNDAPTLAGLVAASGEIDDNPADFDLLLAAVTAADLVGPLNDESADLTVFAPNDGAFVSLAQALGYEGMDEAGALQFALRGLTLLGGGDALPLLTQILLYHVAPESLQSAQVLGSDEIMTLQGGTLTVSGANLVDADPDLPNPMIIGTDLQASNGIAHVIDGVLVPADILMSDGSMDVDLIFGDDTDETFNTGADADLVDAGGGNDVVFAGVGSDIVLGGEGMDRLLGENGADTLNGGNGSDTVNGGDGADHLTGGDAETDLGDIIYAGSGADMVDGGAGNDQIFGMNGDDTIIGGQGADHIKGQNGNDVLTGNGLADQIFGNDGDDFINGGFGHDLLNGGAGADSFYHAGTMGHGSDWIQDFNSAEGDLLIFDRSGLTADDFVVHFNDATSPEGERSGDDGVQEAFVDYQGQVIFALVDGAGLDEINLRLADGSSFDLLG